MVTRIAKRIARGIGGWVRQSPFVNSMVAVVLIGCLGLGVSMVYATKIQPDPQVIRKMEPITNTGVDANGLTLDQWVARGNNPESYQPIRKTVFRPGEVMFVLRQDCFVNKLSTGWVYRVFYGGDRRDAKGDLDTAKQHGTQFIMLPVPIPSRTDGCAVKNHMTVLQPDMPPMVWTYAPGVDFYKNPVQTSFRIHFRPVVIEVVAAARNVTPVRP